LEKIKTKKERLIKIIHESPKAYDINRAFLELTSLGRGILIDAWRAHIGEFNI